jgi:molybdopterin/thiamine biosynthesis adenylyltransferase
MHHRLHGKPIVYDAVEAISNKVFLWDKKNICGVRAQGGEIASVEQYFDVVPATMYGLDDRLTKNHLSPKTQDGTLRTDFDKEFYYFASLEKHGSPFTQAYGTYAWYPDKKHVVRYAPAWWHEVSLVASSGLLYRDAARTLSWLEVRKKLSSLVVGVAGCSVGSSVIHAVMSDMRPKSIKIADKSRYKMENTNRVRIGYHELLDPKNHDILAKKALTVAAQVYALDPYCNVYVYDEGIDSTSVEHFFDGDDFEPALDIIVDEVDDPFIKILLREEARKRKIPLVMVTDVGSIVQCDVVRFDKNPHLSLTFGTHDADLYAARNACQTRPGDRDTFFSFVDALIGQNYRQGELADSIAGRSERPSETLFAQLGSTVMVAGGVAAETIARIALGYEVPERTWFSK